MTHVSILTPTITGRDWYYTRCKNSVRAQTYKGRIEHVTVNGDGLSPAQAFQLALDQAQGSLIMPLADDDWLAPHAVERLASLFTSPHIEWASAQTLISRSTPGASSNVVGHRPDLAHMEMMGYDLGGAHMWRKQLTDRIGGFDPRFPNTADYDLYWRFLKSTTGIAYTPEVLYIYTDHPATDGNTNGQSISEQCQAIRNHHLNVTA